VAVHQAVLRVVPPRATGRRIERRPEVAAPAPLRWAERERAGIDRLDRGGVGERAVAQLIVARRQRVHVAMRIGPQHRLLVEVVEAAPAGGGAAVTADEMADPVLYESRRDGIAGVARIVAGDIASVGVDAVSAIAVPRIGRLLRAVARHREATRGGAAVRRPA